MFSYKIWLMDTKATRFAKEYMNNKISQQVRNPWKSASMAKSYSPNPNKVKVCI